jgi:putative transposase
MKYIVGEIAWCHKAGSIGQSDRGIQYCSIEYTNLLQLRNYQISMTQNSDPYENTLAERINVY